MKILRIKVLTYTLQKVIKTTRQQRTELKTKTSIGYKLKRYDQFF